MSNREKIKRALEGLEGLEGVPIEFGDHKLLRYAMEALRYALGATLEVEKES